MEDIQIYYGYNDLNVCINLYRLYIGLIILYKYGLCMFMMFVFIICSVGLFIEVVIQSNVKVNILY